jgi:DNA-binding transcriptional ArsR family regulator
MDDRQAVIALTALAQEHRLRIFRLLVCEGPSGLPASQIAEEVGISATSASFHLKELDRAGLLTATRDGRFIRYAVHIDRIRALLTFLTEDCCQGRPELCGSVVAAAASACKPRRKLKANS